MRPNPTHSPLRPAPLFRILGLVLLLAGLGVSVTGCAVNPVTGEREIALMSEQQEIQLGDQSDDAIVAQYGLVADQEMANYVDALGQRMVPVSHRPDLPFTFRVLDDPVVNAFALPGGYVYITRGILAYLNSEAALAGVVGHEIGHVTARHGVDRYTKQVLLGLGLGVGSMVSETFAEYAGLAGTAGQLLLLKYGREDERQSDRLGVQYATAIGYDTADMAGFFRTLDRLTPEGGRLPSWMSTHPDPGDRYQTVLDLTRQEQQGKPGPFVTERDDYLRRLDGLVFGQDPREGFFENGVFHHPQLRFRFPVPRGWQLQNTKSQVVMAEPDGAAAVIFTGAGNDGPRAAASSFLEQTGGQVLEQGTTSVAGRDGYRTLTRMATDSGTQMVLSTFFTYGGGTWVFHGISSEGAWSTWRPIVTQPVQGFAEETDPAVLGVQPLVVRVVEAPSSGSFSQAVSGYPVPEGADVDGVEGLALLNGLQAGDTVERGRLLKVIRRRTD